MTTKFNMSRDINGFNGFGVDFADDNTSVILSANAAQSFTVPSNTSMGGTGLYTSSVWLLVFEYQPGSTVWVDPTGATAAIPGATPAATTSTLNPVARKVNGGTSISMITPDTTAQVGVAMYALS